MAYLDILGEVEGRHSNPLNLLIELDKDYPVLIENLDSCSFSKNSAVQPSAETAVGILLQAPELNLRTVSLRTGPDGVEVLDFTRNGQIWTPETANQLRSALIAALYETNGGVLDTAAMYAYKATIPEYEAKTELEALTAKFVVNPAVITGDIGAKIRNDHGSVAIKDINIANDGAVYIDLVSEGQCKGCSAAVMGTFNAAVKLIDPRLEKLNVMLQEQRPDLISGYSQPLHLPSAGLRIFEGWEATEEAFHLPRKIGMEQLVAPEDMDMSFPEPASQPTGRPNVRFTIGGVATKLSL